MSDWDDRRRQKLSADREKLLENAERVEVTEENIPVIAKRTGRSEHELTKAYSEAQAKGIRAHVRLPAE